jgi:hypothetical protein
MAYVVFPLDGVNAIRRNPMVRIGVSVGAAYPA